MIAIPIILAILLLFLGAYINFQRVSNLVENGSGEHFLMFIHVVVAIVSVGIALFMIFASLVALSMFYLIGMG